MNTYARRPGLVALCALCSLLWAGCSGKPDGAAPGSAAPGSGATASATANAPTNAASAPLPPVTVTTVKAQQRDVPITLQGSGTVMPLTSVELRAQVSSTVAKVHFAEGQFVKAGQLLFTLDSRSDEANLAKARAQLARDQASLNDAKRQYARAQQLFAQNFISQGAVDTAQTQMESMAAATVADQAAVDAARVALSFGRIVSPLAGRAGAVNLAAGSPVQANQTPLVTITQLDPIGVAFSIPQRNLPEALAALKGGATVTARLSDGSAAFKGRLQFVDSAISASSGTVQAKAVFANPDSRLWPGALVDISQTVSILKDATTLPQAAVVQGPRGTLVYVVEDGKARSQAIKVLYAEGGEVAVAGLAPGAVVVQDGKQNVRPNSPVVERVREAKEAKEAKDGKEAKEPKVAASAAGTQP